jgi:hypothetical protein
MGFTMRFLPLLLAAGASVCLADTVTLNFTSLPSTLQNNNYGSSNATYNGFTGAILNGTTSIELICDDYAHDTVVGSGQNFIYDYSTIDGANPLQNVRFTGSETIVGHSITLTELQAYETAAVLVGELSGISNPSNNTVTNYQYALWSLFTPSAPMNTTQGNLLLAAADLVLSSNPGDQAKVQTYASELEIFTPTDRNPSNQEFLAINPSAPEPAGWALMGVIALAFMHPRIRTRLRAFASRS